MYVVTEKASNLSPKTSAVALNFPKLPIQGTPTCWLSHSRLVNMSTVYPHDDSSADEATSSLGDSTYDFIDDRSIITTDDESQDGTTESINSYDGHDAENFHNASHQGDSAPDEELKVCQGSNPVALDRSGPQSPTTPVLSARTAPSDLEVTSYNERDVIVFEEPSVVGLNPSRLSQGTYALDPMQSKGDSLLGFSDEDTSVKIRQTMASHNLDLYGRSFKVLYVGPIKYKDTIIQKIATALAAPQRSNIRRSDTPGPSKFNVVPITSFGDDRSPEVVLIDSSGVELEVEECVQASFYGRTSANSVIEITLADGTSLESKMTGHNFVVSDGQWRLPDVTVFCVAEKDDFAAKQTRHISRLFMNRHSVRSIVVTDTPQLNAASETMTLDHLTPHICFENSTIDDSRPRVLKRIPVDLTTFSKIDASQMNRNLACLSNATSILRQDQEISCSWEQRINTRHKASFGRHLHGWHLWIKSYCRLAQRTVDLPLAWSLIGLLLISFCLARLANFPWPGWMDNARSKAHTATPSTLASSLSPFPDTSSASPSSGSLASSTSLVPAQVSPSGSLSTYTDIASLLRYHSAQTSDRAETFEIHLLGDRHVVLRSPLWFIKLRAPSLSFRISRDNSELEYGISTLFEGVYALQIPREHAYGLLIVDIWTQSRPIVNETFEVDFGSSWLKIAAWKESTRTVSESVRNEFGQIQASFITGFEKARVNILTSLLRYSDVNSWQHEIGEGRIARQLQQGARTMDPVVAHTKDLTRHLARKFRNGSTFTAEHVKNTGKMLTRKLTEYVHHKNTILLQRAQIVSSAIADTDVQALIRKPYRLKSSSFRNAQKTALRIWWRIRGIPKRKKAYPNRDGLYQNKGMPVLGHHV